MNFTKISRELINSLDFRQMDNFDRSCFMGVESPIALIGDNEDEGILMVIDGGRAELYTYDGCANFDLIDTCEDIRSLPYKTEKQLRIEAEIAKMKEAIIALENELK
jgi:hypothetical protein